MIKGYMLVKTEPGKEYDVAIKIRKLPHVADVTITYGLWDIVVEIVAPHMTDFDRTVMKIRGIDGIEQTATLLGHGSE